LRRGSAGRCGRRDGSARVLAAGLSEVLGQQVVVENFGGAGSTIGANRVAKGPVDGYQFLLGSTGTYAQSQSLYKHPPYDTMKDFAPVVLVTRQVLVLAVRKDLPVNDLQGFIAYTKANQANMQFGSAGRRVRDPSRLRAVQRSDRGSRHARSLSRLKQDADRWPKMPCFQWRSRQAQR
jgi:tripartite-type tricarboxylate transporter receptor subunit TctC